MASSFSTYGEPRHGVYINFLVLPIVRIGRLEAVLSIFHRGLPTGTALMRVFRNPLHLGITMLSVIAVPFPDLYKRLPVEFPPNVVGRSATICPCVVGHLRPVLEHPNGCTCPLRILLHIACAIPNKPFISSGETRDVYDIDLVRHTVDLPAQSSAHAISVNEPSIHFLSLRRQSST